MYVEFDCNYFAEGFQGNKLSCAFRRDTEGQGHGSVSVPSFLSSAFCDSFLGFGRHVPCPWSWVFYTAFPLGAGLCSGGKLPPVIAKRLKLRLLSDVTAIPSYSRGPGFSWKWCLFQRLLSGTSLCLRRRGFSCSHVHALLCFLPRPRAHALTARGSDGAALCPRQPIDCQSPGGAISGIVDLAMLLALVFCFLWEDYGFSEATPLLPPSVQTSFIDFITSECYVAHTTLHSFLRTWELLIPTQQ